MNKNTIDSYVKKLEDCQPKIIKGIRTSVPKKIMGIKLNFSQGLALTRLGYRGTCTMTELSRETSINLTALTGVVESLIRSGLVTRMSDPKDRRLVLVGVTSLGRRAIVGINKYRHDLIKRIVSELGDTERGSIIRGFERVVDVFYEQSIKSNI